MSTQIDLEFHLGEDWLADFTATELGLPVDITNATITFRVATIPGVTVMTRDDDSGITITSSTEGEFSLRVTPAQQISASVAGATRYQYEIKVETSGAIETVQARGHLNVLPSLIT